MVESTSGFLTCTSNADFKQSAISHPFINLLVQTTAQ
jgi:hypothetical protein